METLLFTDIEGSTRLWEEHGEDMARALARHDQILGAAIAEARGEVLKTTGDGLIAAFPDAAAGMTAAVAVQQSLEAEPWGVTGPIRVRMGLHAGDTEHRAGDRFGPVMNRTARIMAAGHGGQILVSAAVAAEVGPHLPTDASLADLGMHRLKDLTVPEHLYQVVHPALRSDFPPPRTLDGRPNNLPQQTTSFLGRSSELSAIELMLDSPGTRMVTITGPGGAGKTRLALQVAAEQLDRFADGVFFVDLTSETTPGGVYEAIVRVLDLPTAGGGDPLNLLVTRLRDRRLLLVLDNFEQVTAAGVGLVEMLQKVPGLQILVTSRETLRVRPEQVYPVPPLALPHPESPPTEIAETEAVQLFASRARAVRPNFEVSSANARTIAEIALRLDGLPLAIELAAARLNVFTPADLLERIRDRLDVLGAGGRDLPDRQRTLWGAIGWSYELLDTTERDLFEAMSVFSSATLPALEAVIGSWDIVDTVGSLVDKSLVRAADGGATQRFSMLLMIKEYAATRLDAQPERAAEMRRAHAAYFTASARLLAQSLRAWDRESALNEIDLEIGNLATAWRQVVETGSTTEVLDLLEDFWVILEVKGWYRTAIEVASDALQRLDDDHRGEEMMVRTARARAVMAVTGYTEEVEAEFRTALDLSDAVADPAQAFPVLRALATYHMGKSDFASAEHYARKLLDLGDATGDTAIQIDGNYMFGAVTAFTGRIHEGLPYLDRAIELHDPRIHHSTRFRLGPNTGVAARVASGLVLWQHGKLEPAIRRLEEALSVARAMDHPYSVAYALYHNALLALYRGRLDECVDLAGLLEVVAGENDYVIWQTLATMLQGVSATHQGDIDGGFELTETAVRLYRGTTAPPIFWPFILALRAVVHALAGRIDEALVLSDEAVALGSGKVDENPDLLVTRGDVLAMAGDLERAEDAYVGALAGGRALDLRLVELQALTRLVELRRTRGVEPDRSDELRAVFDTFDGGLDEGDLVRARRLLTASEPSS